MIVLKILHINEWQRCVCAQGLVIQAMVYALERQVKNVRPESFVAKAAETGT